MRRDDVILQSSEASRTSRGRGRSLESHDAEPDDKAICDEKRRVDDNK